MAGKLKKTSSEKEELKEKLARALADYQNLVKRVERERDEIVLRANRNLLKDLLSVLDTLERAQEHLRDQGLGMTIQQFQKTLENSGVKEIKIEKGQKFDEGKHEATELIEGGESETIAQVLSKGYEWQDGVVLRPAQVKVYNGKVDEKAKKEAEKELERGDYV